MNKEAQCEKLRKELEVIGKKLDKLMTTPELDFQGELDALCANHYFVVISAECGGPVVIRGGFGPSDVVEIEISKHGSIKTSAEIFYSLEAMEQFVDLAKAVGESHGC